MTRPLILLMLLALLPSIATAQAIRPLAPADPADVATIDAIVEALYETVQRPPGERYDWDRMLSLVLPTARMIPNTEQRGGGFSVLTPQQFAAWIDSVTVFGGPTDRGFAEEQISARVERFGDIAHVFSTYQKHFWDDDRILGRGINSIQLVWHDDRWWITSIIWDEESGAGPLPERYLEGVGPSSPSDGGAGGATAVDAELEAAYARFTRAYRQADREMLLDSVYSESAFYLPPNSPVLRGRDHLREQFAFLQGFGSGNGPHISFDIVDRDVSGDLAYDIGVYTLRPPGSPPDADGSQGKFIVIWKRDADGRWRMHADGYSPVQ